MSAGFGGFRKIAKKELESISDAAWFRERQITAKQDTKIRIQGHERDFLNLSSSDSLGLSSNPEVIKAGVEALKEYGAGMGSPRAICGTLDIQKELEFKIAKFHGREDSMVYSSCYMANLGVFEVILGAEDAVFSDELNHVSIIDGIKRCKARKLVYKHKQMQDLESPLKGSQNCRTKLIVTDGVFSMDGDVAPLPEMCDLADKYNAMVLVDESHATGIFGKTGRGTEEYFGLPPGRVDIINSTLGKAMSGAVGGYITGPKILVDLLRQRSRPYIFTNPLPPSVVACASKVFDLLKDSSHLMEKITRNTIQFRTTMEEAGFNVSGDPAHAVCPVILGDAGLTKQFADEILDASVLCGDTSSRWGH